MGEQDDMAARDHARSTCAATEVEPPPPKWGAYEYRIVTDQWAGFEVQRRRRGWFGWGVWRQPISNTHDTVQQAEAWAIRYAAGPAKYLGVLPVASRAAESSPRLVASDISRDAK